MYFNVRIERNVHKRDKNAFLPIKNIRLKFA